MPFSEPPPKIEDMIHYSRQRIQIKKNRGGGGGGGRRSEEGSKQQLKPVPGFRFSILQSSGCSLQTIEVRTETLPAKPTPVFIKVHFGT
ncbi:hypothetical protein SAY87_012409 [Trapa incisa]|uniref:Uncharacterized protein n=1 Tax=Trapa incisa TaxID=236973 RepID=A0AAN7H130_9MYRT|nr:hypothetical protein SAY87_012409 [Trapa incisa]